MILEYHINNTVKGIRRTLDRIPLNNVFKENITTSM